jgi:GAF domain-containing protein
MLLRDSVYKVPLVDHDDLFRGQPFATRENIQAVCSVPLKFRDERMGVLFVNYRRPHTFSRTEDKTIALFADQVAIAIRNARVVEEQEKRLKELQALSELSKHLLGAGKLKKIMKLAVDNAAESLSADFVAIVLPDDTGRLRIKEVHGWTQPDIDAYEKETGGKFQTDYTIEVGKPVVVLNYGRENRFKTPEIVTSKGIKSGLSVPMFRGEEKVGAMLVHSRSSRLFTESEAHRLSLIANLTAIAIKQLQTIEEEIDLMASVQRASDQISSIEIEASQKDVLDRVAHKVAQILPQAYLVTIELTDQPEEMPLEIAERKRKLVKLATPVLGPRAYLAGQMNLTRFESVFPEEWRDELTNRMLLSKASEQVQKRLSSLEAGGKLGIAKRAIRMKQVQNVPDVSKDPDYLDLTDERTKSELSVPLLLDNGTAIGVINIESERLDAFDDADVQALETLARLAAAVTHNVSQYKLLEGTLKLVESSTLLAWFGMASSMWGHAIEGDAINISNNIMLLRRILDSHRIGGSFREQVEKKLQVIEKMAVQIRDTPTTALLSYEEGVSDIDINKVIRTRMSELWLNEYYERVTYRLKLDDKHPLVRCNTDWIKRLLEILVDNAVEAMSGTRDPLLTIGTDIVEGGVEITVTDNGPGVPEEIQPKLFNERINKPEGSTGLGIALLIVQAVARVYKGQSKLRQTGPEGTTMSVWLPLAKPDESTG